MTNKRAGLLERLVEPRYISDEDHARTPDAALNLLYDFRRERKEAAEAISSLLKALEPFATFAAHAVDEEGWSGNTQQERIVDWFGPSDFREARAALNSDAPLSIAVDDVRVLTALLDYSDGAFIPMEPAVRQAITAAITAIGSHSKKGPDQSIQGG